MEFLRNTAFLNFAINAIILIFVVFANKEALARLRRLINLFDNGGFRDCPYYELELRKARRKFTRKGVTNYGRSNERKCPVTR